MELSPSSWAAYYYWLFPFEVCFLIARNMGSLARLARISAWTGAAALIGMEASVLYSHNDEPSSESRKVLESTLRMPLIFVFCKKQWTGSLFLARALAACFLPDWFIRGEFLVWSLCSIVSRFCVFLIVLQNCHAQEQKTADQQCSKHEKQSKPVQIKCTPKMAPQFDGLNFYETFIPSQR